MIFLGFDPGKMFEAPRSSEWPTLEKKVREAAGSCAACGTTKDLAVHHIRPFHIFPEDELKEENLICLCQRHHIELGHLEDWASINPDVVKMRLGRMLGTQILMSRSGK
jgi:hypothetical protein